MNRWPNLAAAPDFVPFGQKWIGKKMVSRQIAKSFRSSKIGILFKLWAKALSESNKFLGDFSKFFFNLFLTKF